jgi:ABC-type transport system involved in multi-copper enzyme maturation permease subunit
MNPIIRRELLELLRTRLVVALQLGLALACAVLVLVRWPTGDMADRNGDRALDVLRVFGYGLLAGIVLLVPAFPATSLVREKIKGTLGLLLNSPLRPWSIYVGKLGGVLGFTAILLVMTFPAAAACYALGGTAGSHGILSLYGVLVLAATQLSTMALLVSSYSQSTVGALRVTYGLVLAVCVGTLLPHALLAGTTGPVPAAAWWLRSLSPIPPLMEILTQVNAASHGLSNDSGAVGRYALAAGLASAACAVVTVLRINHAMLDQARAAGVMTEDRSDLGQVARRLLFLVDPQRRSRSVPLWVNAVMVKEFRTRRFGRSSWTLRLIALSAIVSLGLSVIAMQGALGWGVERIGGGLVLLQIALLILFAPSLAGGLISSEREGGTWQLLRMTPLTPGAIVRGKLMSVALPLLLLLCATLPGYIAMMAIKPALIPQMERVVTCLLITAVFAVLVSAAASSLFRSTATAMAVSYAALLVVCAGPLLIQLGEEAPFGHATVEAALSIDPVAAALQAADWPGFERYELLPMTWWVVGGACAGLLLLLGLRTWQLCRPE